MYEGNDRDDADVAGAKYSSKRSWHEVHKVLDMLELQSSNVL